MVQEEKSPETSQKFLPIMNGYLKKIKSSQKIFLALDERTSCLQIYENHRMFRDCKPPNKSLNLNKLLDVTRLSNKRHSYAFVLFLPDEKLSFAADCEEDLMKWINTIETSRYKNTKEILCPDKKWKVAMKLKGIALTKNLQGEFTLHVTPNICSLVDLRSDATMLSIPMWLIRKTGYTENVVFLELHENSFYLSNELWLDVESNEVAEDIHAAFKCLRKPRTRTLLDQYMEKRTLPSERTSGKSLCDADDFPYTEITIDSDFGESSSSPNSGVSRSSSMEIQDSLTSSTCYEDVFTFQPIIDEHENEQELLNSLEKHFMNTNYVMHKSSTSSSFADDESEAAYQQQSEDQDIYVNKNSFIHSLSDSSLNQVAENLALKKPISIEESQANEDCRYNFLHSARAICDQSNRKTEDYVKMDPVKLVHFKTETTHFGEPFYESIKESGDSPKSSSKGNKLLAGNKNNVISPKQPILPRRNHQQKSSFYVNPDEYNSTDAYESVEIHDNRLKDEEERKMKSLDMIDNKHKKDLHRNGTYQEVKPKLRQTARSRSVDKSSLNRELVTIKFPNRKVDESFREEDEKQTSDEQFRQNVPTRSKSTPTKSTKFEHVEVDVHDDLDSEYVNRSISENTGYVNNDVKKVVTNRILPGYEVMEPAEIEEHTDEKEEATYDNVDSPSRISISLSYADIDIKKSQRNTAAFDKNDDHHDLPESPSSTKQSRDLPTRYTIIDFEKSLGISQAVKGARPNLEDMSHKTFKK